MDKANYIPDVVLILPAFVLYIITWVVTLALAFTSLGDLLLGAYKIVHWTTFTQFLWDPFVIGATFVIIENYN